MILRPYQRLAVEAVDRELVERQQRSTILVMATGLGKTVVAASVCNRWRPRGRILFLAHRSELLDQAQDKIRRATALSTAIEQADQVVRPDRLPDVTIASVATLRGERLAHFPRDAFALVVRDEAHHACAETDRAIADHFRGARLLGLTATPTRTDGQSLSLIFRSVAFEYRIRQAIADGWLAPIRRRRFEIPGLDLSAVRGSSDFTDEDLQRVLDTDPMVAAVAKAIVGAVGARRTMVFCPGVQHARRVAAAIDRLTHAGAALAIDGTASPAERAGVLEQFRAGRAQYVANCSLFTEGFDEPSLEAIAVARPTKAPGLFTQIVGRGLRLSSETGKRDCLVLEIAGRTANRQHLVTCIDILGYDETAKVRARAGELLARDPALTVCDALDRAHNEGVRPAAAAGAPPVRAATTGQDGLYWALKLDGLVLVDHIDGTGPANSVQRGELAAAGIDRPGLDVRQAAMLLEGLRRRKAQGLTSPKQAAVLRRFGYEPDCSSREAGRIMARLSKTGWQRAGAQH